MKTWKLEMLVVAALLLAVNILRSKIFTHEMLAVIAVLLTFGHAQIADRMAEQEGLKETPDVKCYNRLLYYFVAKEIFWCLYFLLSHAYSALVGVLIFLAYPFWRKFYRKSIRPL